MTELLEQASPAAPVATTTQHVFEVLKEALAGMVGVATTATLLRRALRRAVALEPELQQFSISRDSFDYRYETPSAWKTTPPPGSLRQLCMELKVLLVELTGNVVLRRLQGIAELASTQLFIEE